MLVKEKKKNMKLNIKTKKKLYYKTKLKWNV